MTRSTEIVLSQSENRFLSERVESRVADFGSGPTADTFSAILAKLRRRMRGAVRLSEMEAAELIWLLGMLIHHEFPANVLRAFRHTLAKLRGAALIEDHAPVR
jgi:hypothetical protein